MLLLAAYHDAFVQPPPRIATPGSSIDAIGLQKADFPLGFLQLASMHLPATLEKRATRNFQDRYHRRYGSTVA